MRRGRAQRWRVVEGAPREVAGGFEESAVVGSGWLGVKEPSFWSAVPSVDARCTRRLLRVSRDARQGAAAPLTMALFGRFHFGANTDFAKYF